MSKTYDRKPFEQSKFFKVSRKSTYVYYDTFISIAYKNTIIPSKIILLLYSK